MSNNVPDFVIDAVRHRLAELRAHQNHLAATIQQIEVWLAEVAPPIPQQDNEAFLRELEAIDGLERLRIHPPDD